MLEELIKCKNDFKYFVETYVKIVHPVKGLIPLEMYSYQSRLVEFYQNNRFIIYKKFRQGGFTTITVLYCLWLAMFHEDEKIVFGAKTERECQHIGKIINSAIANFPEWLIPNMKVNSLSEKSFTLTNSKITFRSLDSCRSQMATLLVIDEAAFIPNMEEKWKAIYPVLSTGGKCIILSTVNGIGNWFYETYNRSLEGSNSFKIFDVSYTEHPYYKDKKWVEGMRERLGEKGFHQEVLGDFIGSESKNPKDMSNEELAEELISFYGKRPLIKEVVNRLKEVL